MKREDSFYSSTFLSLAVLFVTLLLISNIIAGRLILVFGLVLPSAVILFPVTYILGDVLTEVYGFRKARIVIWMGFAANILMSLTFLAAIALPFPSFFTDQDAWAKVLGITPRIVAASLIAYWVGEFANSITLSALKKATKGKYLWMRTISSTILGEGLDTTLFIAIAFTGIVPSPLILQMILAQYLFKVTYEVVLTPFTYLVVGLLKRREKTDAFDVGTIYNPFSIGG